MENMEQDNIVTEQPVAEQPAAEQPVSEQPVQQPEETGFYHGAGAGKRETTFAYTGQPPIYQTAWQPQQTYYQTPAPAYSQPPKEKKGTGKRVFSWILVVAMIVGSCLATGLIVGGIMKGRNDALKRNFDEIVSLMQDRLEKLEGVGEGVGSLEKPEGNLSASQVYEQNIQSVVAITCNVTVSNGYGQAYQSTSSGSGFVMSADGYIITNHHVVDGAANGKITVSFENGDKYTARLIGSDASSDIALLKIDATGLRPVTIGKSSSLAVGDQVVAIGNALGELSFSLTVGYVSGIDRDVNTDGSVMNMLQTDAAINSGNSGGPLFNARGEVIGINTAKYSGTTSSGAAIEGISFAIPMDDVIGMLEDLRDYGHIKGVSMGVMVSDVDAATAEKYNFPKGVYIEEVLAGTPAQQAGLRAMDIITELGGHKIENMNDLTRALRNFEAGQTVSVTVWRSGTLQVLSITLAEKTTN